jgi:hypothetical protein
VSFKEILASMGETGEWGENPHASLLSVEANKGRIRPEAGDVGEQFAPFAQNSPQPNRAPIKETRPTRPIRPAEGKKVMDRERRAKVEAMLAEQPSTRFALAVEDDQTDPVICWLAIRGVATFEMQIPQHSYDGVLLLELVEKHSRCEQ